MTVLRVSFLKREDTVEAYNAVDRRQMLSYGAPLAFLRLGAAVPAERRGWMSDVDDLGRLVAVRVDVWQRRVVQGRVQLKLNRRQPQVESQYRWRKREERDETMWLAPRDPCPLWPGKRSMSDV